MLLASVLALGFLHGLGADHLTAIAALSLAVPAGSSRYGRAFWLAVKFAAGHALFLCVAAAAVLFFGWELPQSLDHAGEVMGGWLLITLGLIGGWLTLTGRVYAHSHAHAHSRDDHDHSHWHLHIGRRHDHSARSVHIALPGVLGAVFAVSGLRALIISLPLWGAPHVFGTLISLVAAFAFGIVISMSLFGIVLSHALDPRRMSLQVARLAAATTALASLALGIYWIQ